jgi:hypothetical protein
MCPGPQQDLDAVSVLRGLNALGYTRVPSLPGRRPPRGHPSCRARRSGPADAVHERDHGGVSSDITTASEGPIVCISYTGRCLLGHNPGLRRSPMIGHRLAHYEIHEKLGEGGMGGFTAPTIPACSVLWRSRCCHRAAFLTAPPVDGFSARRAQPQRSTIRTSSPFTRLALRAIPTSSRCST